MIIFRIILALVLPLVLLPCAIHADTSVENTEASIASSLESGQFEAALAQAHGAIIEMEAHSRGRASEYADSLGLVFFNHDAGDEAIALFQLGLRIREDALGLDHLDLAEPLETLATVYYILERFSDAVAPQRRALDIHMKHLSHDDVRVALSRRELAAVFYAQARYGEAEPMLRLALNHFERFDPENLETIASFNRDLAETCRIQNNYKEAEQRFVAALWMARKISPPDSPELAGYLNNFAGLHRDMGRFDAAERQLEEAHHILSKADVGDELANVTLNLAEIYRYQSRFDKAEEYYLEALALAQTYLHELSVAEFHNQLASLYEDTGRPDAAEEQYRKSLSILESSPHASPLALSQTRHDIGELFRRLNRYESATDSYAKALELREGTLGPAHPLVAATLVGTAKAQTANLSNYSDDAMAMLTRAISMLEKSSMEPETKADALASRARLNHLIQKHGHAIEDLMASIAVIEDLRPRRGGGEVERIRFLERYLDYFDLLVQWQIDAGNSVAAINTAERARARVFADQLGRGNVDWRTSDSSPDAKELRRKESQLSKALGECQARIRYLQSQPNIGEDDRKEMQSLESECDRVAENYQRVYVRLRQTQAGVGNAAVGMGIQEFSRTVLSTRRALLLYHVGAHSAHAFVVRGGSDDVRVVPLEISEHAGAALKVDPGPLTRSKLKRILTGYDDAGRGAEHLGLLYHLQKKPAGALAARVHARLSALFETIAPKAVWNDIRTVGQVVVVPHAALQALPFEALVVDAGKGAYWLDRGPSIRYAPSMSALGSLTDRAKRAEGNKRTATGVLSISNPAYGSGIGDGAESASTAAGYLRGVFERGGGRLTELPGTARETEALRVAFGSNNVRVLEGLGANERSVRDAIGQHRLIHVATHGLVHEGRSELLASLALTPSAEPNPPLENDGFLQLFEIYDLHLDTDLVVLSACQTHVGRYAAGEGVIALSRAFLAAGSSRVVASLWEVDDASTAALMGRFFESIAEAERSGKRVDYVESLRGAKRHLRAREEWSHPFYWAPFLISGAE